MDIAAVDALADPPVVRFPERFNAAHDLIERNLRAGRAGKPAFIDDAGTYTYGELAERVTRFAAALRRLGVEPRERALLCLRDGIDFPTAFLGSILAGVIPVPVNTLLAAELKTFIKSRLAPYKYPRWIEFVEDLPKTATGKIQRFKLRECKPAS